MKYREREGGREGANRTTSCEKSKRFPTYRKEPETCFHITFFRLVEESKMDLL